MDTIKSNLLIYSNYGEIFSSIKINKKFLIGITPLIFISFPIKALSLMYMLIYFIYILPFIKVNYKYLFAISFIIINNLISNIIYFNSFNFVKNYLLFWIFLLPIIFFIIEKENNNLKFKSQYISKKIIEFYIWLQLIVSGLDSLYIFFKFKSFDLSSGDILAGTFRVPLTFRPDASNVIFTFSLILILLLYISYFKKISKLLLIFSIIIIFLSSVNHLILISLIGLLFTLSKRNFIKVLLIFLFIIVLYKILQPANFNMILNRMKIVFLSLGNLELFAEYSFKGKYILNFLNDFKNNFFSFLTFGLGAGTYSSRAAMFFSGDYVNSFKFISITSLFENNTLYLWKNFLNSPSWQQGSFNYPFFSIFSFIAELGLINTLLLFILFYKKLKFLKRKGVLSSKSFKFLIIFLFISGFVDNYYEYFQSFFLFYYIGKKLC